MTQHYIFSEDASQYQILIIIISLPYFANKMQSRLITAQDIQLHQENTKIFISSLLNLY